MIAPTLTAQVTELQAERDELRARLAILELAAHRAARVMYRRGYLAGHSAASKGATTTRGPLPQAPRQGASMTSQLLTIRQVADLFQCSPKTVKRAIDRGDLRAAQLAERGVWRIRPEDADTWFEIRSLPPAPPHVDPVMPQASPVARLRGRRQVAGMLTVPTQERRSA